MSGKRLVHIKVTPEVFVDWFKEGKGHYEVVNGLPDDAEFRRLEYIGDHDVYWLIVWSSEFDELKEAEPIPSFSPVFQRAVRS